MVMRNTTSVKRWRKSSGFTAVLTSAVLEWLLILLLFVHALFSYLLTRLARFWELQTPCLICSRLDHLFGDEKDEFYLDLICADHKQEISSPVFCHVHNKLADVHGMCEKCLRSFSTEKKSNSETHRLLAGTLENNLECYGHLDPLLKDTVQGSSIEKLCSCCNEPWTLRLENHNMVQPKSYGSDDPELDIPLPASLEKDHLTLHSGFNFRPEESKEVESSNVGAHSFDPLSPIGYSVLKITSDSESEVLPSDDDRNSPFHGGNDGKEDIRAQSVRLEAQSVDSEYLPKTLSGDMAAEELTRQVCASERSVLVAHVQQDGGESPDLTSSAFASVDGHSVEHFNLLSVEEKAGASSEPNLIPLKEVPSSSSVGNVLAQELPTSPVVGHGVEEFNLLYTEEKVGASSEPKLIPQKEVPSSSSVGDVLVQEFSVSPDVGHGLEDLILPPIEEKNVTSLEPEHISLRDVQPSSDDGKSFVEELKHTSNVTGVDIIEPASCEESPKICEVGNGLVTSIVTGVDIIKPASCEESPKSCEVGNGLVTSTGDVRINELCNDRGPPVTNLMDLSDAYKLVITNKRNEASSMPEHVTVNTRVSGDLKLWLSQISSARGLELSLSEMSPRVYGTWDDSKMSEASSPMGLQILQKRISLERNMSGFESLDGSIVSEIEGESVVDRLKRQVDYDRKSMNALYKDLEEERNASAVAANQALAMITRLQEEKATLQMEALQYLRMMEEQAEYDVDALQKANALLAEKEKEVQDLEVELEICRKKNSRESFPEKTEEAISDSKESIMNMERLDVSRIGFAISTPCNTPREPLFEGRKELERTYMMNGYNNAPLSKESLVGFEDEKAYISKCLKKLEKKLYLFSNNGIQLSNGGSDEKEVNGVDHVRQLHYEEGTQGASQKREDMLSIQKDSSVCTLDQENGSFPKEHSDEEKDQDTHLTVLEQELFHLNERLKALEADRNFLEHTMNSLRTGDGIEFIQEIAQDLRELRKIGVRREQALK